MNKKSPRYTIDNIHVNPGERLRINIDMGSVYDFSDVKMPVEVIRGKEDGPTLFVSATIHGDEINGIDIVRKLLARKELKKIRGMLIAIPIVNIFGFNDRSRYLSDRRDLNRCFPGLENGSLAAQLAYKFVKEIVDKSDYGIDLHTGAFHRCNYPQIRTDITNEENLDLAKSFRAPIVIHSNLRDGSLRACVSQKNIPMILFEAGEAMRFDEEAIKIGVEGIVNVMKKIGMISSKSKKSSSKKPFIALSTAWVRAPQSGIHTPHQKLGKIVRKGEVLGEISNPFGDRRTLIKASKSGMIIGISKLPLANKGNALFHIACHGKSDEIEEDPRIYDYFSKIDFIDSK